MLVSIPLWTVVLVVVLILTTLVICFIKTQRLEKRLAIFLQGKDALSLETLLATLTQKHTLLEERLIFHKEALENINTRIKKNIKSSPVIRYNAFEDITGDQSFATSFLNEDGDGFILSVITHRNRTNIYSKKISKFKPESPLTAEEKLSLSESQK